MAYFFINGEMLPQEKASLGITDVGLLRGYGIFDFFRCRRQKPLFLDDYLNRFFHSARLMDLACPFSKVELEGQVRDLLVKNNFEHSGMRLVLTGGYSPDGYHIAKPNLLLLNTPISNFSGDLYEQGARLLTYQYQREYPEAKTTNYIVSLRKQVECTQKKAIDVLYHNGEDVFEASRSNIFIVSDGVIITPQQGVLPGITRKHTLILADEKFTIEQRALGLRELYNAEEVFLTSSAKKIMPVIQVDDHTIGDGKPGMATRYLIKAFEELESAYLR